jgi:DNA-binding MarR family transcriptional regulator
LPSSIRSVSCGRVSARCCNLHVGETTRRERERERSLLHPRFDSIQCSALQNFVGVVRLPTTCGLTRSGRSSSTKERARPDATVASSPNLHLLAERQQGLSLTQVARELGITAAAVCDCVGALRKKGFVTQKRNPQDRRRLTLRLTAEGQAIAHEAITSDPLHEVFAGLGGAEQQLLQVLLLKTIYALEARGALPPQRTCVRCQFFRPFYAAHSHTPHLCLQAKRPLSEREVRFDCPVFAAADRQTQATVWEAFGDGVATRIASDPPFRHRAPNATASSGERGLS